MAATAYLQTLNSENSRRGYRTGIRTFLGFIYNEKVATDDQMDTLATRYLEDQRNYRNDLIGFVKSISTPKTARAYFFPVKEWLLYSGKELSRQDEYFIMKRLPEGEAMTEDELITKPQIQAILTHADVRLKSFILLLASTGLRVDEALSITLDDFPVDEKGNIDLDSDPVKIVIRGNRKNGKGTKNKTTRYVFLTLEAKEALKLWLKIRNKYVTVSNRRSPYHRGADPITDRRIYPYKRTALFVSWKTALNKSGLIKKDTESGRATLSLHGFRRYFKTNLSLSATMPSEVVEFLLGHLTGQLRESYQRLKDIPEKVAELFKENEHLLSINVPADIYAREIIDVSKKMEQTKQDVKDVWLARTVMEEQLRLMAEKNQKLEAELHELKQQFVGAMKQLGRTKVQLEKSQLESNSH